MIVSIASPDKLSIAMFLTFLLKNLGQGYVVGETHSLMSVDSIKAYVESMLAMNPKTVFTYYARRILKPDCIPPKLLEVSDAVVWFNMYETKYTLIKDKDNFDNLFTETWDKNLKQLGG